MSQESPLCPAVDNPPALERRLEESVWRLIVVGGASMRALELASFGFFVSLRASGHNGGVPLQNRSRLELSVTVHVGLGSSVVHISAADARARPIVHGMPCPAPPVSLLTVSVPPYCVGSRYILGDEQSGVCTDTR